MKPAVLSTDVRNDACYAIKDPCNRTRISSYGMTPPVATEFGRVSAVCGLKCVSSYLGMGKCISSYLVLSVPAVEG